MCSRVFVRPLRRHASAQVARIRRRAAAFRRTAPRPGKNDELKTRRQRPRGTPKMKVICLRHEEQKMDARSSSTHCWNHSAAMLTLQLCRAGITVRPTVFSRQLTDSYASASCDE
jgi:hypothetical protein